ncbi:MAG TPA: FAD-dependent oxidoreductase [Pseudonocardiaceae bacterium]
MKVRVVGAGVIGLSCAVRLREAGVDAHVVASEFGARTTSAAAAALWYPYRVGPADLVRGWGRATFHELVRLAADPATGVTMRDGVQYLRVPADPPDWAADVPGFRVRVGGLAGPYAAVWSFTAPVADSTAYLHWLHDRLAALGGTVRAAAVSSVAEALAGVDRAVLATGYGARSLPGDPEVRGGRGQVVRVRAPLVRRWVLDEHHPDGIVYVIPRRHDVVCGGVDEACDDEAPGDKAPDGGPNPAVAGAILRRCREVVPELAGAQVLGHAAGIRPIRSTVRLQRVHDVVHCYGHGGAGYTLSWGCADAVRDLVMATM